MSLDFNQNADKSTVFEAVEIFLKEENFTIVNKDDSRPWGGFFVLDENQAEAFIARFFAHLTMKNFEGFEKLSPKILIVAPNKRLSWQYHHRRAEIWKLIGGVAGVVISDTDEETGLKNLQVDDVVELECGQRHRLVGTSGYGIVAEIWQHTDKTNPSDESDIVRVQDDFGR
ncbi:phosphoheptose isomerase [Marinilongibacter aquaticus]|uniref:phosphoheptose isomerase n=1 Tax=Marinilongibacter aquaticus TaxID=2975157 RepID=UPI0021BD40FF|nr:phosphoheptose isomerase [Marinilongibacter aquaticus]UBM60885.1 phosphoheptose isomerase [Marinilongibacter aquaticus]